MPIPIARIRNAAMTSRRIRIQRIVRLMRAMSPLQGQQQAEAEQALGEASVMVILSKPSG
jgi:hypothetical protein